MKKILWIIPILLLVTGCGKAEKKGSIACAYASKDVVNGYSITSKYNIYYTGEFVDSVSTEEIVSSEDNDILDMFESKLKDTYEKTDKEYSGYKYKITRDNESVISKVTIDYHKMNIEKFIEDQPSMKNYAENGKLKVEGIKSIYTTMGATCK